MSEQIRVRPVWRASRGRYVLRWRDPDGQRHEAQTDPPTDREDDAWQQAVALAAKLEQDASQEYVPWDVVRDRFEREVMAGQRPKSRRSWRTALDRFDRLMGPTTLASVTTSLISRYVDQLHQQHLSLSSIASYLRELRQTVRWAADVWPDYPVPRIRFPRIAKGDLMKGRPIVTEEFERMLGKASEVVGPELAPSWRFLLTGLWHSALRLGEALDLYWDREDKMHVYGIDQRRPMLRILAESEKGNRERLLPIIPDFARLLWSVPPEARRGRVFRPLLSRGPTTSLETASATICRIGEAANVAVGTRKRRVKDKAGRVIGSEAVSKYASAQDLRRGFGARLAPRVHPMQLKELMRHESLETTLRYYVGIQAQRTAVDVWAALGAETPKMGESSDQTGDRILGPADRWDS